ncbi:MAG: type II toxin-antitoxin system RelE/ParE family toxin [Rhodocyclaceae bacterium]|nr:type II toxin-antitoxin system RelE/ParE family toxin [Rhodocyclaceae bacterium]
MKLFWTPTARENRKEIRRYIAADNRKAASNMDQLFSKAASRLIDHPKMGRSGRLTNTRELVVHRNYILIYDITDDTLRILRVMHVARQWPPT